MDMYADDLISREELNDKIGGMRKEIERLENELKMVSYHLTKGEQLESGLQQTFKAVSYTHLTGDGLAYAACLRFGGMGYSRTFV